MTEELRKLKEDVDLMISEAGIPNITKDAVRDTCTRFALPELYKVEKNPTYNFDECFGYDIYVEPVYRSNGTKENISLRIDINEWNHSSGHTVHRVKFSVKDSKKKVARLVNEIINAYKGLLEDKQ